MPESMPSHNDFVRYREKVRGTFPELFKRYGGSDDISDIELNAQYIFNNHQK